MPMIPAQLRGNPLESHSFLPFTYMCSSRAQQEAIGRHLRDLGESGGINDLVVVMHASGRLDVHRLAA